MATMILPPDPAGPSEVDVILGVAPTPPDEILHGVRQDAETLFTWDYERSRPALSRLYEKAKTSQWNAATDLDWSLDVDQEQVAVAMMANDARDAAAFETVARDVGLDLSSWGPREWIEFGVQSQNWALSQFLHGEQGALACTAKIVGTVPWIDAKYYAATQTVDEARHVEAFSRYLDEKLSGHYPVNGHLRLLLDGIVADSRWDMTYLGMQIMVEGLALAAFGFMHQMTTDPLLKKLLRYVMSDEARHVAFGVISLQEVYAGLSAAEIRERQEFAYDAAVAMRNRFMQVEVWERMGVDPRKIVEIMLRLDNEESRVFQEMLFSKIVPNCRKLGLLDAADGWLRDRFTEIGVIRFEHWADTGSEYEDLDEVAKDRSLAGTG